VLDREVHGFCRLSPKPQVYAIFSFSKSIMGLSPFDLVGGKGNKGLELDIPYEGARIAL